jgi:hypothetical protein
MEEHPDSVDVGSSDLTAESLAEALPELPEPDVMYEAARDDYSERYAYTADQMRSYALLAVKAERERCARIAERWRNTMDKSPVEQILSAIRKG